MTKECREKILYLKIFDFDEFKGPLTLLLAGGGVNLTPPPRFFRKSPKTGGNLDQQKNISESNSFPEILKKIACNLVQPFSHRNHAINMGRGGGVKLTPPI